jgi:UDP-N-acetylmuramoylalanine--D-glutamate ligase
MGDLIAVFGAGISGKAVAALVELEGDKVHFYDEQEADCFSEFGQSNIKDYKCFIFSPGFPQKHPWRALLKGSDQVYGEVGFAAKRWKGRIIGITGTNGKTSVTRLLEDCLRASGQAVVAVGNIGHPFSEVVASDLNNAKTVALCEISSFQAELIKGLELDGLLWTNFSEDHLNFHENLSEYFSAKLNLVGALKDGALFSVGQQLLEYKPAEFWQSKGAKILVTEGALPVKLSRQSVCRAVPQTWNFNLVHGFLREWGLGDAIIISAANDFELEPHRLSMILDGASFRIWEDSKSTNLDSVLAALKAMKGPVYWMGGGAQKKCDLANFARAISPHIEKAFLFGAVSRELKGAFLELNQEAYQFGSISDAFIDCLKQIKQINQSAHNQPVEILFSPGFSSFDQFSSYKARGNYFSSNVFSLLKQNPTL